MGELVAVDLGGDQRRGEVVGGAFQPLGGEPVHQFREGDKFLLFYGAANRDPEVFARPHEFDLTRTPNPHVGFGGHGPHFCLGAHLARREIGVAFRTLFDRLPDLEVSGEPDRLKSSFINGLKHLPATLTGSR